VGDEKYLGVSHADALSRDPRTKKERKMGGRRRNHFEASKYYLKR